MFRKFLGFFNEPNWTLDVTQNVRKDDWLSKRAIGYSELIGSCGGHSFGKGLYRLHKVEEIDRWNAQVTEGFPDYQGRIQVFGFDWLGRQFALDKANEKDVQLRTLMFELGTGQVLEIPCTFLEFHNEEIPNYHDACLAAGFFNEWLSTHPSEIKHEQCV